jgi:hypothetical protein
MTAAASVSNYFAFQTEEAIMAVYVDVRRGALVVPNLYCRIKLIGGGKASAYYQIELLTGPNGEVINILDMTQTHYTFADRDDAPSLNVMQPPWIQAYADLKDRFNKGLLPWCNAMSDDI